MFFSRRRKRAAVLGCGPAGMFAVHALMGAGWDVTVYSRKRISQMYGAQYLHSPIPGLPERSVLLDYQLWGTAADYAKKVYGDTGMARLVSPVALRGARQVWDIRTAYRAAYDRYEDLIFDVPNIDHSWVVGEFGNPEASKYWDLVINSIPRKRLCGDTAHAFYSANIWAAGDAPDQDRWSPVTVGPNTVVCNGEDAPAWYRCSNVFGHNTCEWPESSKPPLSELALVEKPIRTTCDCLKRMSIANVGRYGTWRKGVLSHESYNWARTWAGLK